MSNPLEKAIEGRLYDEAVSLIQKGEALPESPYQTDRLYEILLDNKAFKVINALVEKGLISTDLYEYDSLDNSFYKKLLKKTTSNRESMDWLINFLQKTDNLNDEVSGTSLLQLALKEGVVPEVLEACIQAGCDPGFKNNAEQNYLIQVTKLNMLPKEKRIRYAEIFVNAGVSVDETDIVQKTALHSAIEFNKPELLELFLQNGASPNLQDRDGNSAYYYALAHKFDVNIYKQLAQFESADFSLSNKDEQTPLSDFLRMMQSSHSDAQLLEALLEDGADLNAVAKHYNRDKNGWDWIAEKKENILKIAIEKSGQDINQQDNNGSTLLHKVCAYDSNYDQNTAKETYKKVKLLLDAGADPSITNTNDETPIDLAAKDNLKTKVVEILLNATRK